MTDTQGSRSLQLDREAAGSIRLAGSQLKAKALPLVGFDHHPRLRVNLVAVPAFQRQKHAGRLLSPHPDVAFIRLALHEAHPRAVQSLVLDPDFSFARRERHALTLSPNENVFRKEPELPASRAALEGAPLATHPGLQAARIRRVRRGLVCGISGACLPGRSRRRFLKTLAKYHLAKQAAVDLVVYILDTGTREVTAHAVTGLICMHDDLRFLRRTGNANEKQAQAEPWEPCLIHGRAF